MVMSNNHGDACLAAARENSLMPPAVLNLDWFDIGYKKTRMLADPMLADPQ